jgi:hypothetical protein
VRQTHNLADRHTLSPKQFARYLLLVGVLLVLLLALQIRKAIWLGEANGQLQRELAAQRAAQGGAVAPTVAITKEQLNRQAERIAFANSLIAKDAFKWSVLLERLEQTLTEGIALERVQPDPRTGDISLVGRARDLSGLQGYLHGLSRSQWFADAYLLEQDRVADKEPGVQPFLRFTIAVKEAF